MNDHLRMSGYNRTVKLQWLDETLDLFLAGMADAEIYEALSERLKGELSVGSTAPRGSREKTITLLIDENLDSRSSVATAVSQRRNSSSAGNAPVGKATAALGMTMAVYPFWRVVADVTGRLFRLQGTLAPMQVQRRVKELLGEREAVARSTRYVLRAFADWGVIVDSARSGEYLPAPQVSVATRRWLHGSWNLSFWRSRMALRTFEASSIVPPCSRSRSAEWFPSGSRSRADWKLSGIIWRKPSYVLAINALLIPTTRER